MTKKLVKATLPLIPGKDYILQGHYNTDRSVTFIGPSNIDPKYGVFYVGQVYRPCHYDYIYREVKTKTMWSYLIDWGNCVSGSTHVFDTVEGRDQYMKNKSHDVYKRTPFSFELEE